MKNLIKKLDRYYNGFIDQSSDWHFFLGLSDYVGFVVNTPETKLVVEEVSQKREKAQKIPNDLLRKAEEDIKKVKNKLFKRLKLQKISYDVLEKLIQEYKNYEEDKNLSSLPKAIKLYKLLAEIIRSLFQNGYKLIIEDFFENNCIDKDISSGYIRDLSCFKYINLYDKQQTIFDDKLLTEIWGAWNNLCLAFLVIERKDEEYQKLKKDKKRFWEAYNFSGLIGEMNSIKEKFEKPYLIRHNDWKLIHFIKQNYIGYVARFHTYLITRLENVIEEIQKTAKKFDSPSFDKDKGILYVQDKEIKITKFTDQYYMLDLIFKSSENQQKDWQYSEIQEFIDQEKPSDWKRLYNIAYALRNKIAIETGIKDFFITTKQSIKINPQYLRKS